MMLRHAVCGLVAVALPGLASAPALSGSPDVRLEIDSGGHRGTIRALAFAAGGELLFSASDDRTLRVWDWFAGTTRAVLRGQIGDAEEGMVFALAPAPDGSAVASGGYFAPVLAGDGYGDIRVHDVATGRMRHLIEGRRLPVYALAYSPERDELVAVGQGHEVHRWAAPFTDPVELPAWDGDAAAMDAVVWALGGARLVAITADYGLRLWEADAGAAIVPDDAASLFDANLRALAVSADGERIAIGGEGGLLQVRAARDGALVADLGPLPYRPSGLAFLDGDSALAVSCGYDCSTAHRTTVVDIASREVRAAYRGHDGGVSAAAVLDGALIATAGGSGQEIHLWRPGHGAAERVLKGTGRPVMAVALDPRGRAVAWGETDPCPEQVLCPATPGALSAQLALPAPQVFLEPPRPAGPDSALFARAAHSADGWALEIAPRQGTGFEGAALTVAGPAGPRALLRDGREGYFHGAFTLIPGAGVLVSGGANGFLASYGLDDRRLRRVFAGHTGDILAIAAAPEAGLIATGSADRTLRLWDIDTAALIASVFVAGEDWIIWTPQGYYHASPGGDRLIGWHVNQGRDREGRMVRAYQLKRELHSPEIVRHALLWRDPARAVRELRGPHRELAELLASPPPDFELRLLDDIAGREGFLVAEIAGGALADLEGYGYAVMVNDRRVFPERMQRPGDDRLLFLIPVFEDRTEVRIVAENDFGQVTARSAEAMVQPSQTLPTGRLRVAVVGVNDYPLLPDGCSGRPCDLTFPVADALGFLATVADRSRPLFAGMEALALVNESALDRHADLLARLEGVLDLDTILEPDARTVTFALADFLDDVDDPNDTTIVFIAGHGINIDEDYFFIPTDGARRDADRWRTASLVDWRSLQAALARTPGRKILVLDTCHAAGAYNPRLAKDAADDRLHVFSATAANNVALERRDLGHGIFTYAILEGLRGRARIGDEGVTVFALAAFVGAEVRRLSQDRQVPFFSFEQTQDFLLARP